MRILMAIHGYPPTHNGGAEQRAERTARCLVARGYDVRVVCIETANASHVGLRWSDSVQDGVPVRRLSYRFADGPEGFQASYDNTQIGAVLADVIDTWQPDVLHVFSGYLMSASVVRVAAERHVPVVVSLTDYWWLCHRLHMLRADGSRCPAPSPTGCARCYAENFRRYRLPARVWPWSADVMWNAAEAVPALGEQLGVPAQIERAQVLHTTLNQAAALIAPSHFLAKRYVEHGIDPQRLHISRQGVQLDACPRRMHSATLRVGYLGQIKSHKGVHLLLQAWERLVGDRPRQLLMYGSDAGERAYGAHIRAQVAELHNATWNGQFLSKDVWPVLANLDVLVMPSRWAENSPNSILEAQAMGVPIVGSNLGGIAELVTHERNGLLFSVDNVEELAAQLQRLLDEPELLGRLRGATLPFRSLDDELDDIGALYQHVVTQYTTAARTLESITL